MSDVNVSEGTLENRPVERSHNPAHDRFGAFVPGKAKIFEPTGSGVLDGKTVAVKDVFDTAGLPTGYGNPVWEQTHSIPSSDAPVVAQLRRHGSRIVGKTLTDELAFSLTGSNFHYGAPINSSAPDRLTGGSSCGSAAAVAGHLCDIGLGTDTAGSIRAPASFCGIFGFRPSHGVIPVDGVCRLAGSFDTVGWLTRDAQTLSAVGKALLPVELEEPSTAAWCFFENAWASVSADSLRDADPMFAALEQSLGKPEAFHLEITELRDYVAAFRTLQLYEVWKELGEWVTRAQPMLGPDVHERLLAGSQIRDEDYAAADHFRDKVRDRFRNLLEGGKILCMPTVPNAAPLRTASIADLNAQRISDLSFLAIASLAGLPQLSMPLLSVDKAPLGLSLLGAVGSDAQLLNVATRIENTASHGQLSQLN